LMTERGGADGYVFTAWRARPAEGRIEARGKFKRSAGKKGGESATPAGETPTTAEGMQHDGAEEVLVKRKRSVSSLATELAMTEKVAEVTSPTKKRKSEDGNLEA